ncbi:hypothetical protein EUBVEN_00010 [Eubacterium ventriosum ATCC 27560]|uniref:Uncharacterized protein n=1 Tax=Eubacterium ventriosum ATCC 27560 TaxID=411463 RepID=A5Z2Y6_9FIRM|nr:hypothetical protein EUBVEN_00010 [Eubacterium ventriosum ATCC 27560]
MGDDTFKESEHIVSHARATLKEEGVSFEKVKKIIGILYRTFCRQMKRK